MIGNVSEYFFGCVKCEDDYPCVTPTPTPSVTTTLTTTPTPTVTKTLTPTKTQTPSPTTTSGKSLPLPTPTASENTRSARLIGCCRDVSIYARVPISDKYEIGNQVVFEDECYTIVGFSKVIVLN